MMLAATDSAGWWVGLAAGFVVVVAFVCLVLVVTTLAARVADQTQAAADQLPAVRDQTAALREVEQINGSANAILRAIRAARTALANS